MEKKITGNFIVDNRLTVGQHIRYLQDECGMTNEVLAHEVGYEPRQLSRLKRGDTKITDETIKDIAVALKKRLENIETVDDDEAEKAVQELTNVSVRLERGLQKKAEEVKKAQKVKKADETEKTEEKRFLMSDEEYYLAEDQELKLVEDNLFHALNNADLHALNVIANHREAFLKIYDYEWEFIGYVLKLDDLDSGSENVSYYDYVKEYMFEYPICPEAFLHNINMHNTYLYEIKCALHESADEVKDKDALIKNILEKPDKLLSKNYSLVEVFTDGINFLRDIKEETWDMLILFSQLHDYVVIGQPSNKQCLVLEYIQRLVDKS